MAEVIIQADYIGHCSLEQAQASLGQAASKAKQIQRSISIAAGDTENPQEILSFPFLRPPVEEAGISLTSALHNRERFGDPQSQVPRKSLNKTASWAGRTPALHISLLLFSHTTEFHLDTGSLTILEGTQAGVHSG